jgi:hypothetical protein
MEAASRGRGNRPCTASSTQISSSSSSQRSARPFKRRMALSNWACGAFAKSGYFVAGKLTSRWSASSIQMRRPSTQQRTAATGCCPLVSMEANIGIQKRLAMLLDEPVNVAQLGFAESVVGCERNRAQPKLRLDVFASNVNVWRFISFTTIKVKSVGTDPQHGGHAWIVGAALTLSNAYSSRRFIINVSSSE